MAIHYSSSAPVSRAQLIGHVLMVALATLLIDAVRQHNRASCASPGVQVSMEDDWLEEDARGTGTWGGECTCPNGKSYLVSDENNMCSTLACVGGTYSKCSHTEDPRWAHKRVHCAPAKSSLAASARSLPTPAPPPPSLPRSSPPPPAQVLLPSPLPPSTSPPPSPPPPPPPREFISSVLPPLASSSAAGGLCAAASGTWPLLGLGALLGCALTLLLQCALRGGGAEGKRGDADDGDEGGAEGDGSGGGDEWGNRDQRGGGGGDDSLVVQPRPAASSSSSSASSSSAAASSSSAVMLRPGPHPREAVDRPTEALGSYHRDAPTPPPALWAPPPPLLTTGITATPAVSLPPPSLPPPSLPPPSLPPMTTPAVTLHPRSSTSPATRATGPATGRATGFAADPAADPPAAAPSTPHAPSAGQPPSRPPPPEPQPRPDHWLPAPLERHLADGQRQLQGPTAQGDWQVLTYLPSVEALRYESGGGAAGRPRTKMQVLGVSMPRWTAISACATMGAWQLAVEKLLHEATHAKAKAAKAEQPGRA